jgi:hypothetical protein
LQVTGITGLFHGTGLIQNFLEVILSVAHGEWFQVSRNPLCGAGVWATVMVMSNIFYVTEDLHTWAGSCHAQCHREGPVAFSVLVLGSLSSCPLPPAGRGLAGSCRLCPRGADVCCPKACEAAQLRSCTLVFSEGCESALRLLSDRQGEGGSGEDGAWGHGGSCQSQHWEKISTRQGTQLAEPGE